MWTGYRPPSLRKLRQRERENQNHDLRTLDPKSSKAAWRSHRMTKQEAMRYLRECMNGKHGEEAREEAERFYRECLQRLPDDELVTELRRRGLLD